MKPARLPILQVVEPLVGDPAGGTTVTVLGKRLRDVEFWIGGCRCQRLPAPLSSTLATLLTPAHAVGLYPILAVSPQGQVYHTKSFEYRHLGP